MAIFLIIVFLIIGYLMLKSASKSKSKGIGNSNVTPMKRPSTKKEIQQSNERWLEERWKQAEEQKSSEIIGIFPEWYYDEITERQIKKFNELGVSFLKNITKGQASDLIGMQEPADDESIKILKFFKIKASGISQTQARHKVALIFEDQENVQKWKERPPAIYQKDFFKFFGIKLVRGTSYEQAATLINDYESDMADKNDPKLEEWEAYEQILDELSDPDFRETYEIKKASSTLIKKALAELLENGNSYLDISDDIDLLLINLLN